MHGCGGSNRPSGLLEYSDDGEEIGGVQGLLDVAYAEEDNEEEDESHQAVYRDGLDQDARNHDCRISYFLAHMDSTIATCKLQHVRHLTARWPSGGGQGNSLTEEAVSDGQHAQTPGHTTRLPALLRCPQLGEDKFRSAATSKKHHRDNDRNEKGDVHDAPEHL